jgi:octaheme c-type cytochrome (tetrathionate reductase family)
MKDFKYIWVVGLTVTLLIVALPVLIFVNATRAAAAPDDPWDHVPERIPDVGHEALLQGPFETGPEVTAACLECHPEAADQVSHTTHFTWLSEPVEVDWSDEPVATGKKNLLNNFCIGIQSNYGGCISCHAGYGWSDADYAFDSADVDCLVCHDQSGLYAKTSNGLPGENVDLLASAQSVGTPTRENCGGCHFNGGGGNGVKHGDLDESLYFPTENIDVHMGRLDFQCVDCHWTTDHQIGGRSMTSSVDSAGQIACTQCHEPTLHEDGRISDHVDTVACQSCHVPAGALRDPTKTFWDWSTAGQDWPEDPHVYLKIKGSFIYENNTVPEYAWFNGDVAYRYLLGDPLNPDGATVLNPPAGNINDPDAKIWPFKIHRALQPYDPVYGYLLQPKTIGEFWVNFDWNAAFIAGMKEVGLPYSGQYGFAPTEMYWPQTHMVQPAENALSCTDCHGEESRMDWVALGYPGDPMLWGGRTVAQPTAER